MATYVGGPLLLACTVAYAGLGVWNIADFFRTKNEVVTRIVHGDGDSVRILRTGAVTCLLKNGQHAPTCGWTADFPQLHN